MTTKRRAFRRMVFAAVLGCAVGTMAVAAAPVAAGEIGVTQRVGVGLEAGAAPGLSAKAWVSNTRALDLGLGIGLGDFACNDRFNPCGQRMSFHLDYLFHPGRDVSNLRWLAWHLGFGGRVWFYEYGQTADSMMFALRVPVGLELMVLNTFEIFAEVVPSLGFRPTLGFIEGTVGARMYLF
jgi:hypothetical protein